MEIFRLRDVRLDVRRFGVQAEQDFQDFLESKISGRPTKRLDKACGINRAGIVVCQPQVDLCLNHYRFTPHDDPLLIYQGFPDFMWLVGVTRHQDIFQGREREWMHAWQNVIHWDGNEHHLDALNAEFGLLE